MVESQASRILIDTPPELRLQLLATGIEDVDAVLFTHAHADHSHGIDDLRAINVRRKAAIPVYGSADTLEQLAKKFDYIFDESIRPIPGMAKPEASPHVIAPGEHFTVGDVDIVGVPVPHGNVTVFAYRLGPLAYVTDAKSLPASALDVLRGARVLVINALFRTDHPAHLSIPQAVSAAREIGAERTYLTHLTHDNFHAVLEAELPRGIAPAYDGLTVDI